jgi:outer membrane protein TolC
MQASYSYSATRLSGIGAGSDPNTAQNSQFSINATIPLFVGGYRVAKVRAAKLGEQKAVLSLAQKRADVEAALAQIRMEMAAARSQMDTAKLQSDTAQRALRLSQTSYTSGLITRLDLAKAQDQADQARVGFENAVFQYLCAYYDWNNAVGREEGAR